MFDVHAAAGERRVGEVRHAVGADARRRLQVPRLFGGGDLVVAFPAWTTARQQLAAGLLRRLEIGVARDRRVDRRSPRSPRCREWSRFLARGSWARRVRARTPSTPPPGSRARIRHRPSTRPPSSSSWTFSTRATRGSPRPCSASYHRNPPRAHRGRSGPRPEQPLPVPGRSSCSGHRCVWRGLACRLLCGSRGSCSRLLYDIDGFGKVSPPRRWTSRSAKPC